jgi:4-amino-4-deoxy-L-arabinose transferase-like glycosyltransferase
LSSLIRNYGLLFIGCVLFHVLGTWSLPLIDRDEPRFAEASREMIERGDYVVPYFNNQYRFDKPPLAYWAQVASYKIFGENDLTARLPSVIAAALVALSIFAWGSRIGGNRLGWWAAIIFTLSLQIFLHAKAAVADMWLVLFVTLTHWAGYELIEDQKTPNAHRFWWWTFYAALALGFLAKGPIGFFPLITVAAMKLQDRQPQLGKRFAFVRGMLLALALISLWAIPAIAETHGEFLRVGLGRHVIKRSFAAMEGHGGSSLVTYLLFLPFYFVAIFISFFPWSIKLPWLTGRLWRDKAAASGSGYSTKGKIDNYLLVGSAIVFIIFTLVGTKLPHYTLPAFPLLALLLAHQLVLAEFSGQRFKAIAIGTAIVFAGVALVVPPLVAPAFPARQLFEESKNDLRPEMEFGAVDFAEASLVWYFRSRVHGWMTTLDRESAKPFMEKAGARFIVLPTNLAETLFADRPSNWKTFSHRGFNIAKGQQVDLTLVLKPD